MFFVGGAFVTFACLVSWLLARSITSRMEQTVSVLRDLAQGDLTGRLPTTGTDEILHYHERTWEIYQVLEGRLKIAVKPFRLALWEVVSLEVHDMVLLTPGIIHLVDGTCQHVSQVIQSPPSLSDKVVIHQQDEIDAAKAVLQDR